MMAARRTGFYTMVQKSEVISTPPRHFLTRTGLSTRHERLSMRGITRNTLFNERTAAREHQKMSNPEESAYESD
jgi:hypothetical protein